MNKKIVELKQDENIAKQIELNKMNEIWIGSYQIDDLYISRGSFADVHTVKDRVRKVKMCLKVVDLQKRREMLEREQRQD